MKESNINLENAINFLWSHEGLDTGDILNNLKEVNKKEKVIAYYEGVQKS